MCKTKVCFLKVTLLLLLAGAVTSLAAQTLTEQLGGAKTDYTIFWQNSLVDISAQSIYSRGRSAYDSGIDEAYGFGLQSYRLEFITRDKLLELDRGYSRRSRYQMEVENAEGELLLRVFLSRSSIYHFDNAEEFTAISINLENIPLVVFEQAANIRIKIVER